MVRGVNNLWLLPPNGAISICISRLLSLPVCIVVEVNAQGTNGEDDGSKGKPQVIRVVGQVEGVACVDGGKPHKATPTLHEGGNNTTTHDIALVDS